MTIFGLQLGSSPDGFFRSSRDRFLSACLVLLEEKGEWPRTTDIQRKLTTWRDSTSANREARRLPGRFGRFDGERVELSLEAVHRVAPTGSTARSFWLAFSEAQRRYPAEGDPDPAALRAEDLSKQASMSEDRARQALMLLASEGLVEPGADGVWTISPVIRHYLSAADTVTYLHRRRRHERRRLWLRLACKPKVLAREAFRKEGAVRVVGLGALAILAAAGVLWLGAEIWPSGKPVPPKSAGISRSTRDTTSTPHE